MELPRCVVETNPENINLLVHPAMALLNVGYFDRETVVGETVHDAAKQSPVYKNSGSLPADVWRSWMANDVPLAHVPFVQLAESAGVSVPLHRGFVDIVDALLGGNSWRDGLAPERLGLAGLSPERIRDYVETGDPAG
ncbi:MAG: hypothetical protein QGH63_00325 [Rhodospirillales bacterium]|nr:hypothetical protein [Rhodospirillales bacterium]